jgi:mannitol/fructose-specific phosphotransferase system IIA component (Ntr-type)
MTFVSQLRPDLIAIAPPWRGLRPTVSGLVAMLVAGDAVPAARESEAVRAVLAREAEASTAVLDIGVGVPHARLDGVRDTVVALGLSRGGLYEPVPTIVVKIVGLVLSPPAAVDGHLRTLAGIATLLRSPGLRDALLDASDAAAVLDALDRYERSAPIG